MRTVGDPVTWSAAASGAEVNAALCPGMSKVTPLVPPPATAPRAPRPGKPDSDGGAPPGGWSIACGRPVSRTTARVVPASPG